MKESINAKKINCWKLHRYGCVPCIDLPTQSASSSLLSVSPPGRSPALSVSSLSPAPTLPMQGPGGQTRCTASPLPPKPPALFSLSHAQPARGSFTMLHIYRQTLELDMVEFQESEGAVAGTWRHLDQTKRQPSSKWVVIAIPKPMHALWQLSPLIVCLMVGSKLWIANLLGTHSVLIRLVSFFCASSKLHYSIIRYFPHVAEANYQLASSCRWLERSCLALYYYFSVAVLTPWVSFFFFLKQDVSSSSELIKFHRAS
jgi:hypothetical protein